MSRLWTQKELDHIQEDSHLATVFVNQKSYNEQELNAYYTLHAREFICGWYDGEADTATIAAIDLESLKWFLERNYRRLPDKITEKITEYREVIL